MTTTEPQDSELKDAAPTPPIGIWRPGAVSRVVLVPAAGTAVLAGAPTAVTGTLSLLAVVAVAERLARTRRQGAVDAVLITVGGILGALILAGLLLGVSRVPLRPWSWVLILAGPAVLGLVLAEHLSPTSRRRPSWLRAPTWSQLAAALASTVIVVLALVVSVRATNGADVAPVQMSFGRITQTTAQIVVSTDRATGELELRTEAPDGTTLSYPLITVEPDHPVTTSVVLPRKGRYIITLNNPDQTAPLRSLIVDR